MAIAGFFGGYSEQRGSDVDYLRNLESIRSSQARSALEQQQLAQQGSQFGVEMAFRQQQAEEATAAREAEMAFRREQAAEAAAAREEALTAQEEAAMEQRSLQMQENLSKTMAAQMSRVGQLSSQPLPKTKQAAPLGQYLASVESPEDYSAAAVAYQSTGRDMPKWYTGDFETDLPAIKSAVRSELPIQTQLSLQQSAVRESRLGETTSEREERLSSYQDRLLDIREQELASKREGTKRPDITPKKSDVNMALGELQGMPQYADLAPDEMDRLATDVAASVKAKVARGQVGEDAEYPDLVEQTLTDMVNKGQLRPAKETGWFDFELDKPASYSREGQEKEAQAAPASNVLGSTPANPVRVTTVSDYNLLPPGTYYLRPDGKLARKK